MIEIESVKDVIVKRLFIAKGIQTDGRKSDQEPFHHWSEEDRKEAPKIFGCTRWRKMQVSERISGMYREAEGNIRENELIEIAKELGFSPEELEERLK